MTDYLILLGIAALVAGGYWLVLQHQARQRKWHQNLLEHGTPAMARVLSAEMRKTGGRNARYYCHLVLQFQDHNHRRLTVTLHVPDSPDRFDYVAGTDLPIHYDPACPHECLPDVVLRGEIA